MNPRLLLLTLSTLALYSCANRASYTLPSAPAIITIAPSSPTAPVTLSFAQQGAETSRTVGGRVIPGIGVASVQACNHTSADLVRSAGLIDSAARNLGISTISPTLASPILDRSKNKSPFQIGIDVGSLVSSGTGILGTTHIIPMPSGVAAGLSLVPALIPLLQSFFTARLPNESPVLTNLLQGDIALKAGSCSEKLFLYVYNGPWEPKQTAIQ